MGVAVGPGRGSAAGSSCCLLPQNNRYRSSKNMICCLNVLNPDRISMPDIDIDFDDDGRGKVLEWVSKKYGKERSPNCYLRNDGNKMAIKDVARVQKTTIIRIR